VFVILVMKWWKRSKTHALVSNLLLLTLFNILVFFNLACGIDYYKDTIGNTTCTECPKYSFSSNSSTSLSDCLCSRSPGNAQDNGCYG